MELNFRDMGFDSEVYSAPPSSGELRSQAEQRTSHTWRAASWQGLCLVGIAANQTENQTETGMM